MSDLGKNLDLNPSFGTGKAGGPNPAKKNDVEIGTPNNHGSGNKQIEIENRGVYKNPSISQSQLGHEAQERISAESSPKLIGKHDNKHTNKTKQGSESGLNRDYDLKAKNPALAAQLQNPKPNLNQKNKPKKPPPEPSLQVQYSPRKGISINPRKVKPSMPGRLQAFFDDPEKPLDKLSNALNTDDNYDINLAHHYAKKLIKDEAESGLGSSLAQLLNLDEDFVEFTREKLIRQLQEGVSKLKDDPASQSLLTTIIETLINKPDIGMLAPLLQLFLPMPYPFIFANIDEEFELDDKEILDEEEQNEKKSKKNKKDDDDEEETEEDKFDCITAISIKTLNYNKLHFHIQQNTQLNQVKIHIKGDPSASELIIPIESELEEVLFDDVDDIDYLVSTWHDNVLRITESRVLKVKSTGKLNPLMLKLCNAILEGVNNNDIDLGDDDMIEGKFNLI